MSDLIRREDALKALLKLTCKIDSDNYAWIRLSDAFGTVDDDVPSAEPERKKGEWVYPRKFGHAHLLGKCSVCGKYESAEWIVLDNPNFCPRCGADMRGE